MHVTGCGRKRAGGLKMHGRRSNEAVNRTLEHIEKAIEALEGCDGKLTAEGYKTLRGRLGHLMDTLYRVGEALSKST